MSVFNKESNTSQAFMIAAGQFIALCLTLGSTMILSRYMNKFNYGTYKQVFYVYNTLLAVFTLGLPKSFGFFLPRISKEEGKDFVNKSTKLFILMGGVFSGVLFFGAPVISKILNNEELNIALKLFSPVPIFLMPTLGLETIYSSYRETQVAAIYSIVTRVLLFACVTIPAFFCDISYYEAVLGFVVSAFLNFSLALYLKNRPFKGLKLKKTKITVKEILIYCIPLMGAGIFNILINSTDQFYISKYFGTEAFAEFSNGAMELPFIGMIVGACSTVLLPVYSQLNKESNLSNESIDAIVGTWNSVFRKTVMLIFPIIIFCILHAKDIMVLLYGNQYLASGLYFKIMLFNNFASVISCYPILLALNKTKEYSAVYIINFILLAVFEFIVIKIFSTVESVCVVSVICLWFRVLLFMGLIAKALKVKIIKLIPIKVVCIIVIISIAVGVLLQKIVVIDNILYDMVFGFSIFYFAVMLLAYLFHINYLSIIKPLIKRT